MGVACGGIHGAGQARPDGEPGGRGDGPLGIPASPNGPAATHPAGAERSEAQNQDPPSHPRGAESHARIGQPAVSMLARMKRPPSGGLFDVPGRRARIAIRGRRDTGLITARTAARGRPLRPTPADAGSRGVLELLAHAIELRRVIRAEPPIRERRLLAVASTTTTHRYVRIAGSSRTHVPCELLCAPYAGIF
jgi:hypothetical protein